MLMMVVAARPAMEGDDHDEGSLPLWWWSVHVIDEEEEGVGAAAACRRLTCFFLHSAVALALLME
jgi:hypothetical protein